MMIVMIMMMMIVMESARSRLSASTYAMT